MPVDSDKAKMFQDAFRNTNGQEEPDKSFSEKVSSYFSPKPELSPMQRKKKVLDETAETN